MEQEVQAWLPTAPYVTAGAWEHGQVPSCLHGSPGMLAQDFLSAPIFSLFFCEVQLPLWFPVRTWQ